MWATPSPRVRSSAAFTATRYTRHARAIRRRRRSCTGHRQLQLCPTTIRSRAEAFHLKPRTPGCRDGGRGLAKCPGGDRQSAERSREGARAPRHPPLPIGQDPRDSEADDMPVPAPASGLILERKVTVGSVVNVGDELFAMTDPGNLWMIAAANEGGPVELRDGEASSNRGPRLSRPRVPRPHTQTRRTVEPATRTLQIRILVPNPRGLLKPEMYATATSQVRSADRRIPYGSGNPGHRRRLSRVRATCRKQVRDPNREDRSES